MFSVGIIFVILVVGFVLLSDPGCGYMLRKYQGVTIFGVSNETGETIENIRISFIKELGGKKERYVKILKPEQKIFVREKIRCDINFGEINFKLGGKWVKYHSGLTIGPGPILLFVFQKNGEVEEKWVDDYEL